jgi:hypothetical protein
MAFSTGVFRMRTMIATLLASSLLVSSAIAADAPLAPGKPAGVRQADIEAGGVLLWVGVLGLAAGIAVLASNTQGSTAAPATTK